MFCSGVFRWAEIVPNRPLILHASIILDYCHPLQIWAIRPGPHYVHYAFFLQEIKQNAALWFLVVLSWDVLYKHKNPGYYDLMEASVMLKCQLGSGELYLFAWSQHEVSIFFFGRGREEGVVCKAEKIKCKTQNWTGSSHDIKKHNNKHWISSNPEAHFIHMVWMQSFLLDYTQPCLPLNSNTRQFIVKTLMVWHHHHHPTLHPRPPS